ncbi:MAG: antibiotic transport system ATP-binding protein [Chloroflexi bacterium]|nr:MAG: antibiotic transport system ATP-binding protein [Chloroflexota bacterium]MBA4375134.1 multidrug ABC transporter ATP-binding protein [Anaerolinea sp.]
MGSFAIETRSLSKTFVTKRGFWRRKTKSTLAVEDISFNVNQGELFGILGPNGAGKTTTVKMLSTLLLPTSGSISILGLDILKNTLEIRKRIGFTFGGARGLYGRLSARDNLRYFAELYGLAPEITRKRIVELLEMVGLTGREEDRVETFSSGMQQRLHLARALLHNPELIFLDEPTVGIDPVGARELRAAIKTLIARGKTILLTTHYMAEAEELCDRIAIVNKGNIVAMDTPSSLKVRIGRETVIEVDVDQQNLESLKIQLVKLDHLSKVEYSAEKLINRISIHTSEPENILRLLGPFLQAKSIQGLEVRNQTMEDVYVAIIQGEKK